VNKDGRTAVRIPEKFSASTSSPSSSNFDEVSAPFEMKLSKTSSAAKYNSGKIANGNLRSAIETQNKLLILGNNDPEVLLRIAYIG
jgi:hypothetical protein